MKIPVRSLAEVRRRLEERGGTLLHARAPEDNWVLDDPAGTLGAGGRLLRVRRFGERGLVTLKGAASFSTGIKSRVELETEVGDAENALALLSGLGFTSVRRYQKRRELWSFEQVTVTLDETPMGSFVELEGDADRLPSVAAAIELDPSVAARGTYLDLWAAYRADHPEAPEDMVFSG